MKVRYRTHLDDKKDGFIEFSFDGTDTDPATLALVHSLLQQFMDFDRERATMPSTTPADQGAADG